MWPIYTVVGPDRKELREYTRMLRKINDAHIFLIKYARIKKPKTQFISSNSVVTQRVLWFGQAVRFYPWFRKLPNCSSQLSFSLEVHCIWMCPWSHVRRRERKSLQAITSQHQFWPNGDENRRKLKTGVYFRLERLYSLPSIWLFGVAFGLQFLFACK